MALMDPYTGPWTAEEAAHLSRRLTFGATPEQIVELTAEGPDNALTSILDYTPNETATQAALGALSAANPTSVEWQRLDNPDRESRITGWWIFKMVHTSNPFEEQLTLFYQNLLVSEYGKIFDGLPFSSTYGNDGTDSRARCTGGSLAPDPFRRSLITSRLMLEQNELKRSMARGPYRLLLRALTRDPAMLVYLDNRLNRKARPQENYAREVMELFSMGVGNYSEDDVREVAKALTGETTEESCELGWPLTHKFDAANHSQESKTIFGQPPFNFPGPGEDTDRVIDLILSHVSNASISPAHARLPAASIYLAWKMITWFVSETIPIDHPAVEELAEVFFNETEGAERYGVRETLRRLFRSEFFFDPAYRYNMYKHPADFVVTALRTLGIEETSYTGSVQAAMEDMGMRLFTPPNVAGWDHGRPWINSANLVTRYNYANRLTSSQRMTNAWVDNLVQSGILIGKLDVLGAIEYFRARLLQVPLTQEEQDTMVEFTWAVMSKITLSLTNRYRRMIRGIVHVMLSTPRYQLK